ncbi:MAG: beta-ketoacyl-[acyl-carrier-protein] synthase family protein [Planctomycetota bacterium]|jgi:3-oxoacyl-[acyl-carrier-protein] synthase II
MPDRRVAITGLGVVTAAGIGVEPFWQMLTSGQSAIGTIEQFDASEYPCTLAGEVRDFSARSFVPKSYRKSVKVMARDIELAVAAADLAFRDSGIVTKGIEDAGEMTIEPSRLGCNIGAGLICCELEELAAAATTATDAAGRFDIHKWGAEGLGNLNPLWLLKYLPNMLSCHVTIIHGAEGPSNCITCGDASAHMAVGEAAYYVTDAIVDAVIAGGAESKLNQLSLLRQVLLKRLSLTSGENGVCRPFDSHHNGTIIGEGGGLLILEDMDRAKARGATIYAEFVGFGAACDPNALDVTKATVGSLDLAAVKALEDAGVSAEQVDVLITHGTGVPDEDRLEAAAWRAVLGEHTPPAASISGAVGSLFAGAGGAELAAAVMALHTQTVPATVNFSSADDGCDLDLSNESRQSELTYALSGAFTVGGQSAACVLKRVEAGS